MLSGAQGDVNGQDGGWLMVGDWNRNAKMCGNCRFWPLSPCGRVQWDSGDNRLHPNGVGGHACDGTVSDCRRHAPVAVKYDMRLHGDAHWPTTKFHEGCGDFEARE